jgi:hypothetical protein
MPNNRRISAEYAECLPNHFRSYAEKNKGKGKNALPLTCGLAQAGQCLARKFVQILKFCARPSGSVSPACAKPLGRGVT